MVYRPRTPEEMEQINALVRSSVGYDANRGDVVEVEKYAFCKYDAGDRRSAGNINYGLLPKTS